MQHGVCYVCTTGGVLRTCVGHNAFKQLKQDVQEYNIAVLDENAAGDEEQRREEPADELAAGGLNKWPHLAPGLAGATARQALFSKLGGCVQHDGQPPKQFHLPCVHGGSASGKAHKLFASSKSKQLTLTSAASQQLCAECYAEIHGAPPPVLSGQLWAGVRCTCCCISSNADAESRPHGC